MTEKYNSWTSIQLITMITSTLVFPRKYVIKTDKSYISLTHIFYVKLSHGSLPRSASWTNHCSQPQPHLKICPCVLQPYATSGTFDHFTIVAWNAHRILILIHPVEELRDGLRPLFVYHQSTLQIKCLPDHLSVQHRTTKTINCDIFVSQEARIGK
jgi:hypothetical protein